MLCVKLPVQWLHISNHCVFFSFNSPLSFFTLQRDEWMTFDFLAMKTTSTADRRAEKERQKEEERAKAQAIEQVCVCCFFSFWLQSDTTQMHRVIIIFSAYDARRAVSESSN